MSDLTRPTRPIYRNINIGQVAGYRLPAAGLVSIAHRITGAVLFLLLPFMLYLFDRSLTSVGTFARFKDIVGFWPLKIVVLGLMWMFIFHFVAGIRYLVMDLHLLLELESSRTSAITVFVISAVLWLAFALKTLGAF